MFYVRVGKRDLNFYIFLYIFPFVCITFYEIFKRDPPIESCLKEEALFTHSIE